MPNVKKSEPNFFEDVYEVVQLIPRGRVTSYGAIARYLGTGMSARMVGWAMNACPKGLPAHRVVNSKGLLTASHHFPIANSMANRLRKEGLVVENNKILEFARFFWDPRLELL